MRATREVEPAAATIHDSTAPPAITGAVTSEAATVLAFDYGEKRIGVAVGQTLTATAHALATVETRHAEPDWSAIAKLVGQWQPDALLVGLPLNMDGTAQPMTRKARRFRNQLAHRFGLPVFVADERLSTREAWERMLAAHKSKVGVDAFAAEVVLEGWLAREQQTP